MALTTPRNMVTLVREAQKELSAGSTHLTELLLGKLDWVSLRLEQQKGFTFRIVVFLVFSPMFLRRQAEKT